MKQTIKKLTKNDLLNLISDNPDNRLVLSKNTIPPIHKNDVSILQIKNKTAFKLKPTTITHPAQKNLNEYFLSAIPINSSAVAYKKNKSYLDLFEPHLHGYHFLRLDIKSFFHNISEDLIHETFSPYFKNENFFEQKQKLIEIFINLIMFETDDNIKDEKIKNKKILPIGFKTSPAISNIIFRSLDIQIQEFCSKNNITYTRYADDMLFSSQKKYHLIHSEHFINEIAYTLSKKGFKLNLNKTLKKEHTLSLNGYVIESSGVTGQSSTLRLSNKKTIIISKLLDKLKRNVEHKLILKKLFSLSLDENSLRKTNRNEFIKQYNKSQILNKLTGYRSYLISILKYNQKYHCVEDNYISKYSEIIGHLNTEINKLNN